MKLNYQLICNCKNSKHYKIFSYLKPPLLELKYLIKGKYERYYYQCNKCKHMYSKHKMHWNESFYKGQYFNTTYQNKKKLDKRFNLVKNLPINKSDNKNRVIRINKFFKKKGLKVLDIGSGIGVFLYEMKKMGWKVSGIESDKQFVDYSNKKHKLNIYCKDLFKFNSKKKFDLITLNKVLEHVKNPIEMLTKCKDFLKKDGLIHIELPSIKSKNNGKNSEEFCIEHHQVFSSQSLKYLINESGMKPNIVKDIVDPSGKYTIYSFAKIR